MPECYAMQILGKKKKKTNKQTNKKTKEQWSQSKKQ